MQNSAITVCVVCMVCVICLYDKFVFFVWAFMGYIWLAVIEKLLLYFVEIH